MAVLNIYITYYLSRYYACNVYKKSLYIYKITCKKYFLLGNIIKIIIFSILNFK